MLTFLNKTYLLIDQVTEKIGNFLAWFTALMVICMVLIVALRYGFNLGWIALQESVLYLHAFVFMLGCSYTLKHNGHVRVDIFYRRLSIKGQAWVNLFGYLLLLLPTVIFIAMISLNYVINSWQLMEGSREAGGLPGVFILKTLIPLLSVLLALQAISEMIKSLLIIKTGELILEPSNTQI